MNIGLTVKFAYDAIRGNEVEMAFDEFLRHIESGSELYYLTTQVSIGIYLLSDYP